jgi:serine protease Do
MLNNGYKIIKPSIVAIADPRLNNPAMSFPRIIGTGFFLREDGIVVTNNHVLEQIEKSLHDAKTKNIAEVATVITFFKYEDRGGGLAVLPLEIGDMFKVRQQLKSTSNYYGPENPDIGIINLKKVKSCPAIKLSEIIPHEGALMGIAGFPMGERTLNAPGWLHQVGPTLQSAFISSHLPFDCNNPHGFVIDAVLQGGVSGSPLFHPETGDVTGIVYGGLNDYYIDKTREPYKIPTSLGLAIPATYLKAVYEALDRNLGIVEGRKNKIPLLEWAQEQKRYKQKPKGSFLEGTLY